MGVLGGFGLLYTLYQRECHNLLAQQASQCGTTTTTATVDDRRGRKERETGDGDKERQQQQQQQYKYLQRQLERAQADAEAQRREAALAQRDSQDARAAAAAAQNEAAHASQAQTAQVGALQQELKLQAVERQSLADQVAVWTSRLAARATEVEQAQHIAVQAQAKHAALTQDWGSLQQALQERAWAQTILTHGKAPHHVEITLDLGDSRLQSLVLQLDRLDVLPLTTDTFIYLLEAGLYTGTRLQQQSEADILLGGQLDTAPARVRSNLSQRWAAHGLHPDRALLWPSGATVTEAPCPRYGVGVDWEGTGAGEFFIVLNLPSAETASRTCLGRVVHGMEWLPSIRQATIAGTRILVGDVAARDEL
jgi:cyclophilin family peptidyl-prolyl cis-trans isomerase